MKQDQLAPSSIDDYLARAEAALTEAATLVEGDGSLVFNALADVRAARHSLDRLVSLLNQQAGALMSSAEVLGSKS